jgi:hypothetical protein
MLNAVHMNYKLTCSVVTDMVYHTVQCNGNFGFVEEVLQYSCESVLLIYNA